MAQKLNAPDAVVFDVDGTLLDSVDQHARAWVDAFCDYGYRVAFEDVRRQIGKGGDQLMPVFLGARELAEHGKQLEAHRGELLKQRYVPQMRPFPKARALLQRVREDGRRIVLASSARKDELEIYKRIVNIGDLVDVETSADDADRSKPSPDIFEAALERLGMSADRTIAIGDTPYDAQAAGGAGIATIGVLCGGWSEVDLRSAGCMAVYRGPADLLAHYATSPLAAGTPRDSAT